MGECNCKKEENHLLKSKSNMEYFIVLLILIGLYLILKKCI